MTERKVVRILGQVQTLAVHGQKAVEKGTGKVLSEGADPRSILEFLVGFVRAAQQGTILPVKVFGPSPG